MSSTSTLAADCGRRTVPSLIDQRARNNHARPIACISTSPGVFRDVSYPEFANAVNRCARWISQNIGLSQTFATLAYLGPSDLRYQLFLLAAVKTGHVMFVPSPRNNEAAFKALFEECQADILLTTSNEPPAVSTILKANPAMQKHVVPELEALLDPTPVDAVEFSKTWEACRFDPFVRVHTSGSTGTPKLVTLRHGSFTAVDAMQTLGGNELAQRFGEMRVFCSFPPFHVAGITYTVAALLWVDSTVVLPPPGPLTAEIVNGVHTQGNVEFSLLPPSIVTDLAKNEEYLDNLCKLSGVTFAGGPLPESIGSLIASRTRLVAGIGATEFIVLPQLVKDREDWPYFAFDSEGGGLEFQERDAGLFELVIKRRPELDLVQPVFVAFPDLQSFNSKDLYEKHPDPSKSHLWKYRSRLDDIIVFSNGEKLNPVTMEGIVSTCPAVKGCLVAGQGFFQAAALIEPAERVVDESGFIDEVWPYLQKANATTVKHGRVVKPLIILTSPDKPFPRAGKGTIQRAAAMKLYEEEIYAAYRRLEEPTQPSHAAGTISIGHDFRETSRSLSAFIQNELETTNLNADADFFAMGMDSLQLITLVRAINAARPDHWVDLKEVYDNPTVDKLAKSLNSDLTHHNFSNPYDSDDEEVQASWKDMDRMYAEITTSWKSQPPFQSHRKPKKHTPSSVIKSHLRSSEKGPIIPPDSGLTAWLQVLGSFFINVNNWGLVNAFGAFQAYYQSDLLSSSSPNSITWIGTLQGALILLVGVFSGPLFDTGYFRILILSASLTLVFALMMLSLCTTFPEVMLAHTLIGLSSGLLYIPSVALIPVYFKHRRGLALGLATGGGSIGGIIYPIVFTRLIDRIGFGWTVRVMGFIALATLGPAAIITRPLGARTRRQLVHFSALRDTPYLAFAVSAFLVFAALLVPFFLSTTFATAKLKVDMGLAFYMLPVLNAAQFLGRVSTGWWSDYHHRFFGCEALLLLAEFSCGVLGFGWIGVNSLGGYVPWLVVFGFMSGVVSTLPAVVLPYICPNLAVYGTRLGMLYSCAGLGFLISTPVAAALDKGSGKFLGAQLWTGACCIAAAACVSITAVRARKRRLLYESGKPEKRLIKRRVVKETPKSG